MKVEINKKDTEGEPIVIDNVENIYQSDNMLHIEVLKEGTNAEVLKFLEMLQSFECLDNDTKEDAPWEFVLSPAKEKYNLNIIELKLNQEIFELFSVSAD